MSKHIESSLRAGSLKLPVGKVIAGLGAVLVLAGPSAALAQSRECSVTFTVSSAASLGSLQFNVDYAAASALGDLSTSDCVFADASGLTTTDIKAATNTAAIGWANTTAFSAPGLFLTCNFVQPSSLSAAPVAGNFAVSGIDATDAAVPPVAIAAPTVVVAVGACVDVAPVCQNGVVEHDEACDDGNATAGDGCDAACGASSCPTDSLAGCRVSTVVGKSKFSLADAAADNLKDSIGYSWKSGEATVVGDWKNPVAPGSDYSLCIYDGGNLIKGVTVPGGLGWKASGSTGFGFKGDVQGVSQIKVKGGDAGKASIGVKASGKTGNYVSPALPLIGPTLVQFVVDDGVTPLCFQTTAGTPTKNDAASYSTLGNP